MLQHLFVSGFSPYLIHFTNAAAVTKASWPGDVTVHIVRRALTRYPHAAAYHGPRFGFQSSAYVDAETGHVDSALTLRLPFGHDSPASKNKELQQLMPDELKNRIAVVSGASSGIGKAIAIALGAKGAQVCLVGRRAKALESVRDELAAATVSTEVHVCDLAQDHDIANLRDRLASAHGRVDILVHSAGVISLGAIESAPIRHFDEQYRINVRAPYLLTQALLPLVKIAQGEIVFINSSAGNHTREQIGAYAASKHALRAVADTLRMEVNASQVRVLSVYPGNTATAMQNTVQDYTGRRISAEHLLQPEDVASAVLHALLLPRTAEVTDIQIRPFKKSPA